MVQSHTGFLVREGEPPELLVLKASKACFLRSQRAAGNRAADVVVQSCSVVSDSLRPHGLQPARLPCPSLSYLLEFAQIQVHRITNVI